MPVYILEPHNISELSCHSKKNEKLTVKISYIEQKIQFVNLDQGGIIVQ